MKDFFEGIDGRFPWRNCSLLACYREDVEGVASVAFIGYTIFSGFVLYTIRTFCHSYFWLSRLLAIQTSDHMVFWPSGLLVIKSSGLLVISSSGHLIIWPTDNLVIWSSRLLAILLCIWSSDHLVIWSSDYPIIRLSGHLVFWPSQLLDFCSHISKMSWLGYLWPTLL